MRAVDVIRKKRDGGELTTDEIAAFVRAATHGDWPDYQLSALLMAVCVRGMTPVETATLTRLMADSGTRIDLSDIPGPKIDKHSTGGVGDKTSLVLAPLAAACGVVVPMMSGRGLGHTGGTLDKLESIPGFRVGLSVSEFRSALREVGCALIGQTADLAPADRTLYALRDVTGTVESIPLITASILSKKLAEGISGLVMDVKCGRGAFMKALPEARALAESLVRIGTANGLRVEAVITAMDTPLGRAVGNALEVIEAIETLKGSGPTDLEDVSVLLAAKMVRLAGLAADDNEAETKVRTALTSGAGLEKFRQVIEQQGGDPRVINDYSRLPDVPHVARVTAGRGGIVTEVGAGAVGVAAMVLGAGRERAEDPVDRAVGVVVRARPGERVSVGDTVFEVRYRDARKLADALPLLEVAYRLGDAPPHHQPLVIEAIA
ncbi:MAG TPA: thymidine phosphorylase [Fimbriiglobus sp.]|nr:thymidine phosphorylase [Fimbriiglobus sp.]